MKMKVENSKKKIQIDQSTGEIINIVEISTSQQTIKKIVNEEEFVQLYIKDLANIYKITSRTQISLLIVLCEEYSIKDKDVIKTFTALKEDKDRWADKLGIAKGKGIDNALVSLVKKNIILKISRSKYSLNPKYVFMGALKDRPDAVELAIKYEIQYNDSIDLSNEE